MKWMIITTMIVDAKDEAGALEKLYKTTTSEIMKKGDVRLAKGDKWELKLEGGEE